VDEGEVAWHDCQVLDVSDDGAGLQLFGSIPRDEVVVLELRDQVAQANGLQLRSRVCHVAESADGTVRAGVEFVDVTDLERALLDSLLRHHAGA
jgi:hypothetical protein